MAGIRLIARLAVLVAAALAGPALAYEPIVPKLGAPAVVLTGDSLSLENLVAVARYGAKVSYSPAARQRAADTHGLLLEAAAEGVPVYLFNRGGGNGRQNTTFTGDPTSPENKARLEGNQLRAFQNGPRAGQGPEMESEADVRAMMAVRANTIIYDAPSAQLVQGLIDLLNARITPVVQSNRGSVGEADIGVLQNLAGTLVGRGEAYHNGVRMPAAQALAEAGLKPIQPFGADLVALAWTNAYSASQAALLAYDGRQALEWADLIYAMDLLAMNSSITPLAKPTQLNRPEPWLNWHAARMLELIKDSYLFGLDPKRILQDPDSLRASSIRQASAWRAWSELAEAALVQINSSDHNPTFRPGLKPTDSPELSSPWMMQYYVKGGPLSGGKSGYVVSTANWDPYPLVNRVEAFTLALANMDVAVVQRGYKFDYAFHTVVTPGDVFSAEQQAGAPPRGNGTTVIALEAEVEAQLTPVTPVGIASDIQSTSDLMSQAPLKVLKGRRAVAGTMAILAHDLMTAAYWMDVRKAENGGRAFGAAPTAALAAWRQVSPWGVAAADRPEKPAPDLAVAFLASHPAADFARTPAFPK